MARVINRPKLNFLERLYLLEILRGMAITLRHFLDNILHIRKLPTLNYPEQKRILPDAYRARHRLLKDEKGLLKCTACTLCAQACPSGCIFIEAGAHPDPAVKKKYPARYDIDLGRCIFCGFCVEACPFDAIDMKSGIYELCAAELSAFKVNKGILSNF